MSIKRVAQLLGVKSNFEKWAMYDISSTIIFRA